MKHVFGIGATFLLLGVGYYEMSGGADFQPQTMIGAVQAGTPSPETIAQHDIERAESGIPVTAMREFPENVELISASFMPRSPEPAVTQEAATPAIADAEAAFDLRQVSGDWVNMRQGPRHRSCRARHAAARHQGQADRKRGWLGPDRDHHHRRDRLDVRTPAGPRRKLTFLLPTCRKRRPLPGGRLFRCADAPRGP